MSYKQNTKNTSGSDDVAVSKVESLGLVSLEPRILLDAAGFVTGAEVAAEAMAAEGAEMGVQAIFEDGGDTAAAPVDGPWLGEITLSDTGDTSGDNPSAAPVDGPWLGDITLDPSGDTPTAAPVDGPWLGDVTIDTSGDTPTAAPVDGPWLGD